MPRLFRCAVTTMPGLALARQSRRDRAMIRVLFFCCVVLRPLGALADPLLVAAASSLRGALDEIAEAWPGEITISYAGSSALARQIEAGAPFDAFISANADWMQRLVERGLVEPTDVAQIASNALVLVGSVDAGSGEWTEVLETLPPDARIAVGFLDAVPAGIYARQALSGAAILEAYQGRLVQVENVRIALALASRGDVAAAIVYASDAQAENSVSILAGIPSDLHEPVTYTAARLRGADHSDAQGFVDFLIASESRDILAQHGFLEPP